MFFGVIGFRVEGFRVHGCWCFVGGGGGGFL